MGKLPDKPHRSANEESIGSQVVTLLVHSPKFQALLDKSRRQIEETGGIGHSQFWREVVAESQDTTGKSSGTRRRTRRGT